MKKWLHSDLALLLRRIGLLYLALALCRAVFYLYNGDLIGSLAWAEVPALLRGALMFDTVSILYLNLLFAVLSLLPLHVRERQGYRRGLFIYYMVTGTVTVCLNLADAVYFHYTQKRFTAEEVFFADNDNSGQLVLKFAAENWYLVVLAAALVWGLGACYGRRTVPRTPVRDGWPYYAFNAALLPAVIYLGIGGMRGGFTRTTRPITLSNATAYTASPTKANLILSNPFCILRTIGSGKIQYTKYFTEEQLARIYTPYHYPDTTLKREVSMSGRNVVVFILESFSAEHSALLNPDLYPHGGGFTPFLDSLMRGGFTFTNAYSNGRKSIEALPSVLSSIPSFKTPFVLLPQALAPTRALPRLLAGEGYATAFFCGSTRGSMGFGAYASSAGIERQYGREDYEKAHGDGQFDGYWGIWDEPFLQYMGEVLGATPQPFLSAVFTLSSHHPFVVPAQYADSLPQGFTKVHRGVAYTDLAVRRFFEKYGREAWFANTVFVFSADHVSSEVYADKTRTPTGNTHIISFIYTPDGAVGGMHAGVSQQIDLMPTLLGMMDYRKPYFAFGRDVTGEPERFPMAVNYMNQQFQAVTDSVAVFFDERRVTAAYALTDTLQRHNLAAQRNPAVERAEMHLKAFIQQYYSHLERKDYLPRP